MDSALLATLRIHNPWLDRPGDQQALLAASLPEPFVSRHRRLELRPGRAELIVGPRQAGKSTWIREVLIRFWRSKSGAEVDFVVRRGERMVAIEVKAAELARPTVSRGTHSFLEAYRPTCLGVVNASLRLDTVEEGVTVRFVRPWEIDLVLGELEG
jgi:predicted AAA+ superfamily ATPase